LPEPRSARRAGLIGTALIHLLIALGLWLAPAHWVEPDQDLGPAQDRNFLIELAEAEESSAPVEAAPPSFVEVNSDAPVNPPDEAPFVGAQDQQVAQPVPTPEGQSDTPAVERAEDEAEGSTAIVSGEQAAPPEPSAAEILAEVFVSETPNAESVAEQARREAEQAAAAAAAQAINPPAGAETLLAEAGEGAGGLVTPVPPVAGAQTGPEVRAGEVQGSGEAARGGYFVGQAAINPRRPQERPRLSAAAVNARRTPTIKNEFGSKNIGEVAYNAKWSEYGEYLQRLIDAVQVQWERLLLRSAFYPTSGSTVRVKFKLERTGDVLILETSGTGAELAQRLCISAIAERAPYGEWTEDMRALLGEEQELTFTFFYQ
jgi:hypothetical protein